MVNVAAFMVNLQLFEQRNDVDALWLAFLVSTRRRGKRNDLGWRKREYRAASTFLLCGTVYAKTPGLICTATCWH